MGSQFLLASTGILVLVARVVPGMEALFGFLDVDVSAENEATLSQTDATGR
jgi:hypothetical protein